MADVQIFEHEQFGKVRVVVINGITYFVGKDVAQALGYTNPQKALRDHVDDEDKKVNKTFTLGRGSAPTLINESGLYSLILSSKLPDAKKFKRWVTSEVLPAIIRTGEYVDPKRKTEHWLKTRQLGKETRKQETDIIKTFIEYARKQGSKRPEVAFYSSISVLANYSVGLPKKGGRNDANVFQLNNLDLVEGIIGNVLQKGMVAEKYYKEILVDTKNWIEEFLRITFQQTRLLSARC